MKRLAVGILRDQPTGNFQKLLADGLAYAPSLVGADLQRTNLQNAYLREKDVSQADFYRADLSRGSLKAATARDVVFYQARLVGTVFTGADLRRANFFQAELNDARLRGGRLAGATFAEARNVPAEVAVHVDGDGHFTGADEPLAAGTRDEAPGPTLVFVSRPSVLTPTQQAVWRLVEDTLDHARASVQAWARELVT